MGKHHLPISFGVLTTDNRQQAMERCGYKDANKGYEAALTAIEMVSVVRQLPQAR
jgi:6,7-dimethyl-8-ribityllumazine synthase